MNDFLTLDTDITGSQCTYSGLPKQVCIVMPGIADPSMVDPILYQDILNVVGACDGLIRILAEEGHGVVVAYMEDHTTDTLLMEKARVHYARYGVILESVTSGPPTYGPNILDRNWQSIWVLHDWLRTREKFFSVVHVADWKGFSYGALLAKFLGLAFRTTHFVVHGLLPTLWRTEREWCFLSHEEELGWVFVEQRCVELADTFVCADRELMAWMSDVGYKFPERSFLSPANPYPDWTEDFWIAEDKRKTQDASHWRDVWLHWHAQSELFEAVVARFTEKMRAVDMENPSVTICIVHHERPSLVRMAVESVFAQDYTQFDAILVDNGSESPEAKEALEEIEASFQKRGWRVIRQENLYEGAARTVAAAEAQGDWLLFLDDDNLLFPDAVSRLVHAACFSGADAVPAASMRFSGCGDPRDNTSSHIGLLRFLGAARALNVLENVAGDTCTLVRRSAYAATGGFGEERGVSLSDMAFLNRFMGMGFRLEPLPDPVYFYRTHAASISNTWKDPRIFLNSRYLVFASHARTLPAGERAFSAFSLAHYLQNGALGDELADRDARIGALGDELADRDARIVALFNSRSWRVTAPLRSMGRAMRRLAQFTRRVISK